MRRILAGPVLAVAAILALTTSASAQATPATAVFAGGCFWGVEGVFEHVKGVLSATAGYAGGSVPSPSYEQVSTGATGHAESVRVTYDPEVDAAYVYLREPEARHGTVTSLPVENAPGMIVLDFDTV